MKKIVMFDGEIETQQYFTYRMRDEFERLGHEVYTFNRRGMFFRMSRTVPGSGMRSTAPAIIL